MDKPGPEIARFHHDNHSAKNVDGREYDGCFNLIGDIVTTLQHDETDDNEHAQGQHETVPDVQLVTRTTCRRWSSPL